MECSYCKKPCRGGIAFELLELTPGMGPVKKRACFPCIQELGEKIMRPTLESPPTSRYGWSSDPNTDRELRDKYGPSIHEAPG